MKVALIDFDDSFTANISEVLSSIKYSVDVIHWRLVKADSLRRDYDFVVLGPGPGHVGEYKDIFEELNSLNQFPVLGVCLGHQIMLTLKGFKCEPMERPQHGKSFQFKRSGEFLQIPNFKAQLYNSWAILEKNAEKGPALEGASLIFDNGILAIYHQGPWISCQFHPESVGTSYPHAVFESLLKKICIMA